MTIDEGIVSKCKEYNVNISETVEMILAERLRKVIPKLKEMEKESQFNVCIFCGKQKGFKNILVLVKDNKLNPYRIKWGEGGKMEFVEKEKEGLPMNVCRECATTTNPKTNTSFIEEFMSHEGGEERFVPIEKVMNNKARDLISRYLV